ncbi:MAG TPA: tetratricopeptide repeat protein [Bacteroidia bacterium]|nr:tetratricopeptide repeat protein [Bacteroidia bacterium]
MSRMKNIQLIRIFFFLLLSLNLTKAVAIENSILYKDAQKAYKNQDYNQAIALYQQILSNQVVAPEVFYNLGNCYYKSDSIGKAIQYYEKARKLIGDEEDLMHNLKFAHNRTVDKIEPMPEFVVTSTWKNIVNFKTADTWANYMVINFALVFVSLILFQLVKKSSLKKTFFGLSILLIGITAMFYVLAKSRTSADNSINQGVLIVSSSPAKSAPQSAATDLFLIHEGTVFKIIENQMDWCKIRLENGNLGWIQKSAVGEI